MLPTVVSICNDAFTLDICPSLGGRITALRSCVHNADILHPIFINDHTKVGLDKTILVGGSYPLVPYSGRIAQARFPWNGLTHQLPVSPQAYPHALHGISCYKEWHLIDHTDEKIIIEYKHHGNHEWPFDFVATQFFILDDNKFTNKITIKNTDNIHQPIGLGMHPFLSAENLKTVQFSANEIWQRDNEIITKPVDIPPHQDFNSPQPFSQTIDDLFQGNDGRCVAQYDKYTLTIQSANDYAVVFSNDVNTFFCFEPVENASNAHNMQSDTTIKQDSSYPLDYGLLALSPDDKHQLSMSITLT